MGFKRKIVDPGTRKERVSDSPKPVVIRDVPKKGPTIVSIGMELVVAVGLNLFKRHVKNWGAEINAKRKELAAPEKVSSGETLRPRDPIVEAISEEVKKQNSQPPRGGGKEVVWFLLKT